MIDAQTVDLFLRNDPDVSIVAASPDFEYTVDVSVEGMVLPGRVFIDAVRSKTCVILTTETVTDHLAEAFQACERVPNVTIGVDPDGDFILRAAVLKEDSLPLAVTNTLQALAYVKITYDEKVRAKGPPSGD